MGKTPTYFHELNIHQKSLYVVIFTTIFFEFLLKHLIQETLGPTNFAVKALKKLLKPLVNFLISSGITYPVLNDLLKELFVEVAETDFKLVDKQQTDSRINFLTGIHRKDVKRLRNQRSNQAVPAETSSLSALLISRWLADPKYCDDQNKPLPLPRLIKQGGEISFEGLVVSINKDIRSRAILDEWLNMNIVFLNEDDCICLNQNAFIPQQGYEEKAWFFGENLHDHIAAAAHNLKGNTPAFIERAVYYDQLTAESVKELAELSEKLGMETLISVNSLALALQNKDKQSQEAVYRMRLGLYFYKTTDNDTDENEQKKGLTK